MRSIRCDSIEDIQKKCKDTDTVFIFDDISFAGDKIAIEKMLRENTIDHSYLGEVPSGCRFKYNYLSGELSAYALIYQHVFDATIISTEDNWEWKNFSKRVLF